MKDMDKIDIDGLVRGDPEVWSRFVDSSAPIIYTAVQKTCEAHAGGLEHHTVLDLVQDVYVRLARNDFRAIKSYDPKKASLSTWLTVVARNVSIDRLRAQPPVSTPLEQVPEPTVDAALPPEPRVPLPAGLLRPREEAILRMLYEDDMTVRETAALLHVEPQTVRSTRHKALKKLRCHFGVPPDARRTSWG